MCSCRHCAAPGSRRSSGVPFVGRNARGSARCAGTPTKPRTEKTIMCKRCNFLRSAMRSVVVIALILVAGWFGYKQYAVRKPPPPPAAIAPEERVITPPSWYGHPPGTQTSAQSAPSTSSSSATPKFVCDGRVYCSQMRSCEEAMFFLTNCPGTKMDNYGKGNGIPCERQWCGR